MPRTPQKDSPTRLISEVAVLDDCCSVLFSFMVVVLLIGISIILGFTVALLFTSYPVTFPSFICGLIVVLRYIISVSVSWECSVVSCDDTVPEVLALSANTVTRSLPISVIVVSLENSFAKDAVSIVVLVVCSDVLCFRTVAQEDIIRIILNA